MRYSGYIDSGRIRRFDDTQKGPIMADTQSIIITNPDGVAFTLHGVPNGATLQLLPTEPTVPTVAEPTVEAVDTEPTPRTTVAPKGVNRSEGKRLGGKPKAKAKVTQSDKPDPIKRKGQSPLQAAGMAKTRHGRYGSQKTAQAWYDAEMKAGDAERYKVCVKVLRRNFRISKAGKVTAKA